MKELATVNCRTFSHMYVKKNGGETP